MSSHGMTEITNIIKIVTITTDPTDNITIRNIEPLHTEGLVRPPEAVLLHAYHVALVDHVTGTVKVQSIRAEENYFITSLE